MQAPSTAGQYRFRYLLGGGGWVTAALGPDHRRAMIEKRPAHSRVRDVYPGLTVSPDRKTILFSAY
jgi:hypothetical protein